MTVATGRAVRLRVHRGHRVLRGGERAHGIGGSGGGGGVVRSRARRRRRERHLRERVVHADDLLPREILVNVYARIRRFPHDEVPI